MSQDEFELKPEDLRMSEYRQPGCGGFSTAVPLGVSILHIPTGIEACCHDDRSRYTNKVTALARLKEALRTASGPHLTQLDKSMLVQFLRTSDGVLWATMEGQVTGTRLFRAVESGEIRTPYELDLLDAKFYDLKEVINWSQK